MRLAPPALAALALVVPTVPPGTTHAADRPPYKDPSLPVEQRVADLLSRMTLEEKAAQMVAVELKDAVDIRPDGTIDLSAARAVLKDGIGQVTRLTEARGAKSQTAAGTGEAELTPVENARLSNAVQRLLLEQTRLGIPAIVHEECLHGLVARDATSFPHPIALAGTFDPELVEEIYTAIAAETRARGGHQALTPVVDVARDPRWGRVEETFGEDPWLVARMGEAVTRGFQGDASFRDKTRIVATLKHFAGHGQPANGTNAAPANYSERVLREFHFLPFEHVVKKAGALSVMTTYHEIDGVPVNANRWLVTDVLRGEWGFGGFVVADYFAIREMNEREGIGAHRVARDGKEAALLALQAGVNVELPRPDCYRHVPELVREGRVAQSVVDRLVGETLRVKFRMGLFDDPYVDPGRARGLDGNAPERRALARRAAVRAVTMLENKGGFAPLDAGRVRRIAVVGPNADRAMPGGYTGRQPYHVTVLEGIREKLGGRAEVDFAQGCRITIGGSWVEDRVVFPDPAEERELVARAVEVARRADVVVLALGGNEQTSREAWSATHLGDRASLELPGAQNALVDAIHATGRPIVAVVLGGSPFALANLRDKAAVIYQAFYLGQESGRAIADVLFGDASPGGKLPISFARSAGHLPVYYNHKPSERRGYLGDDVSPLYPFGYGLGYTTFEISAPRLERARIASDESVDVHVDVRNTGRRRGDETVQLYVRDEWSSVTRPVKELRGFARVTLDPGQATTVTLRLTPDHLAFFGLDMKRRVEPGEFTVMAGASSRDADLRKATLRVD
jgi:beta-glucosidase